jgi:hypothetical protein
VEGVVLTKVVEYLTYHLTHEVRDFERPITSSIMSEVVPDEWDAQFIDVENQEFLFNIVLVCYTFVWFLSDIVCFLSDIVCFLSDIVWFLSDIVWCEFRQGFFSLSFRLQTIWTLNLF